MSWGHGAWGSQLWGDSDGGGLSIANVFAIAENVLRVEFSGPVFFSGLLEAQDASIPQKYEVAPTAGTVGYDGVPARAVTVVRVDVPAGVAGDEGNFVDLVLDRPMTPYPAKYDVTAEGIFSPDGLLSLDDGTAGTAWALHKTLVLATREATKPSRDVANPQTLAALREAVPNPGDARPQLGTFVVDDTHDYAIDSGLTSFKKRVYRRLVTIKDSFAHLPGYGVGIPSYGKKLSQPATRAQLAAEAEQQIALEPEVAQVTVNAVTSPRSPGLTRFVILIRTRTGQVDKFEPEFSHE